MIETRVRVVSVEYGLAMVEPAEQSGCGACQARSACGVSGLGRFFARRRRPVPVLCNAQAKAGDELVVAVDEAELLKAGLLAYLLPALLAVLGAGLASLGGWGDAGAAAGMASGVALGLVSARVLGRASHLKAQPATHSIHQGEAP